MSNTVYKAHFGDRQTSFVVKITHDDVWIAECDELGLVTEAKSYDELTERVWEIAPELYELNEFGSNPDGMKISFVQEQAYDSRMAL
ncbi:MULTISPECIES: DUF1902 domain-containing protein [Photorhabdus]|uniref:DUF1902 domain-containing protein n=1 Tax=Photorhabdus kayaii TaxID=230088 RepID=A0ABX0AY41_9GAMM|nr:MULTISPECIES: DUF1902 domain-containing protein [Photorhabdus]MCC8375112.1 DUF1902 domain-containing protein [Photorhabdus bodei]MCC8466873.1 DUF1902 domain-containing protein [Photorhabdus bodei]NDL11155.1 DUF1902 domain-containing protein [Photorhabdus kayaii]NDL24786.1 DUF1902 domain-containing protein [Photorhabdus kayaii]RAX11109.1 hypothetical protein CKY10_05030 [Photorhabdus sp. HUG-39]